ncbi:MAG: IclR family transcriptional regulator [Chakrabartia sp.]
MATPRIQSVDRAFSLLNCLVDAGGIGSLPVMASRCGLSVATTHRLLTTLEDVGAVIHIAPGKYRIGTALFRLTNATSIDNIYAAAAEPSLRRLCKSACTAAHLGMLDQDYMVTYLAKASRRAAFPPTVIGSKLEAYCSGLGKVLLAALPVDQQRRYLDEGPFIALTAHTLTEPDALLKELQVVAKRGYAVDDCELFDDLRCVAVPIKDADGRVVAALSASSPAGQMPTKQLPELAAELTRHAAEISERLYPLSGPNRITRQ